MLKPLDPQPYNEKFTTVWISPMGMRFAKFHTAEEALLNRNEAPADWADLGLPKGQNVTAFVLDDKFAQVGSTYVYRLHKKINLNPLEGGVFLCQQ